MMVRLFVQLNCLSIMLLNELSLSYLLKLLRLFTLQKVKLYLGETGLNLACKGGHLDILQYLINNGSSLDVKNNDGKTKILCSLQIATLNITIKYLFFLQKNNYF